MNERIATEIAANNGELAVIDPAAVATGDEQNLGAIALSSNGQLLKGEVANSRSSELVELPTGVHLRVTLVGKKQARVAAKVVSANEQANTQTSSADVSTIKLSSSVETMSTFAVNQWFQLSQADTLNHRPALASNRKVHSTTINNDEQQSVWVKVEVL